MDQPRFNNQPEGFVGAAEAAAFLGVKLATLYAYASRGWIQRAPGTGSRERRYLRSDLERLKARAGARAGHAAVAGAALRWGEPVLDSAITELTPQGPRYRGEDAVKLSASATFEEVAERLWGAGGTARWPEVAELGVPVERLSALLPSGAPPLDALALALPALAAADPQRFATSLPVELVRARVLTRKLAACLALPRRPASVGRALAAGSIAAAALRAFGAQAPPASVALVNQALILAADHELNTSAFAARVTASSGADLYACLSAAVAAVSGPRHGGACDRIEALVEEVVRGGRAEAVVEARARRGEGLAGFSRGPYASGDPRARPLLDGALRLGRPGPRLKALRKLIAAMAELQGEQPSVDTGLLAAAYALELPAGSATALFALGRTAGWIAHCLEQRSAGVLLRPRARYVAPVPGMSDL